MLPSSRVAITLCTQLQRHHPGLHSAALLCLACGLTLACPCCLQGNSSAVKEAVGASLIGCKAPFRLVSDHSRSGRLEASMLSLRKWLFSPAFDK